MATELKTFRERVLDLVEAEKERAQQSLKAADNMLAFLISTPTELRETPVGRVYGISSYHLCIKNTENQVPGLAANLATWLGLDDRAELQMTDPEDEDGGIQYFTFDLSPRFRLDIDCKPRDRPCCRKVRVLEEKVITVCGELPDNYELLEELP